MRLLVATATLVPNSEDFHGNAREVSEALNSACRIVAQYYKSLEQPSAEDLAKELLEFYDDL